MGNNVSFECRRGFITGIGTGVLAVLIREPGRFSRAGINAVSSTDAPCNANGLELSASLKSSHKGSGSIVPFVVAEQ